MAKKLIWHEFTCGACACSFMVCQDDEHKQKNTCCPECRRIVQSKGADNEKKK